MNTDEPRLTIPCARLIISKVTFAFGHSEHLGVYGIRSDLE